MIVNILPYREHYDTKKFGVIGASVADVLKASKYQYQTRVLGSYEASEPLSLNFHHVAEKRRLFETGRKAYLRGCAKFALDHGAKLIEIHNKPSWVKYLVKYCKIPVALYLHEDPQKMRFLQNAASRIKVLNNCAAVYCISEYVKFQLLQGVRDLELINKVHVINNVIEMAPSLELSGKQKIIVFHGELSQQNGAPEFLEALLYAMPDHPDWKALILGQVQDSNFRDTTKKFLRKAIKKLPKQVLHYKNCSSQQRMSWLKVASIVVAPQSGKSSLSRSALESLASGCALITTKGGGVTEMVGNAAIVLSRPDVDFMAYYLNEFMRSPGRLFAYQQHSITRALSIVDNYSSIKRLDAIREELIRRNGF
jgi:glycosyltransferase involved in cell wall biosynthesis